MKCVSRQGSVSKSDFFSFFLTFENIVVVSHIISCLSAGCEKMDTIITSSRQLETKILEEIQTRCGFRRITRQDALKVYNMFERSDAFLVFGPLNIMKILRHIVYPTRTFNFWDIYVSCVRDTEMNDFTINVVSCPNIQIKICRNDVLDVNVVYKDMYYDQMGGIRYRWIVGDDAHIACIETHDELKRFVMNTYSKKSMIAQLSLHPRFLLRFLDDGHTIDEWCLQK